MKVSLILRFILLLIAAPYLFLQVRKPSAFLGRFFAAMMNLSHSRLTDWGLQHITKEGRTRILDVGCGGGRTIEKLAAAAPTSVISGVDYAAGSVAASRSKNAKLIKEGRVEIQQASVSQLPFADDSFDLITAVETHFYWPDLKSDFREVLRTVKPGGTFVVITESYKKGANSSWQQPVMKLLGSTLLTAAEHKNVFHEAGFTEVQSFEENEKGWLCVMGKKLSSQAAS